MMSRGEIRDELKLVASFLNRIRTLGLSLLVLVSCTVVTTGFPPQAFDSSYFHDGVRIHFRDVGVGSTLVFIHGFGASLDTWRHLEDALKQHYRLILLDLKGHGYSDRSQDDRYSLQDHAEVVIGLMEHLDVTNAIVIGNSFGSAVALMVALKDQQKGSETVSGLILIAGTVDPESLPFYLRLLRLPVIGWLTVKLTPVSFGTRLILHRAYYDDGKVTDSLVETYAKYQRIAGTDHSLLTTARQMVPTDVSDLTAKLGGLDVPVLQIIGRHDQIISRESAEGACQILPRCRAVIIDEAGHVPHEEKPDEVVPVLKGFISKLTRPR